MDSVSGSLKQSEPCSPNSPGSPDPMYDRRPTSPHTISKALSSLQRSKSSSFVFHIFENFGLCKYFAFSFFFTLYASRPKAHRH